MVVIKVVYFLVTMVNLFIKFEYKDLLTLLVKFYTTKPVMSFPELYCRVTFFLGMALLTAISLQLFQKNKKISPPVIAVSLP